MTEGRVPPPCPHGFLYTVKPGDTVFSIARRFGVSLEELIAANPHISDPNLIYPGDVLCVPVKAPKPTCPGGFIYIVRPGDTLTSIAHRFGLTVEQILAANPQITDPNLIYPGQPICIPLLPAIPSRRRAFWLHPTSHCPGGMGMGLMDLEKREIWVVAEGLPHPSRFGMDRVVLMVKYRETEDFRVIEMLPLTKEVWMAQEALAVEFDCDPVVLVGAARLYPFVWGPLFLGAVIPAWI